MTWYSVLHGPEVWVAISLVAIGAIVNSVVWLFMWHESKKSDRDDERKGE